MRVDAEVASKSRRGSLKFGDEFERALRSEDLRTRGMKGWKGRKQAMSFLGS